MSTESPVVTLRDFLADMKHPVAWYTAIGTPMGETNAIHGEYGIDIVSLFDLWDLEGEVVDGDWEWDGEGDPRVHNNNSLTRLKVWSDEKQHTRIIREYETAND